MKPNFSLKFAALLLLQCPFSSGVFAQALSPQQNSRNQEIRGNSQSLHQTIDKELQSSIQRSPYNILFIVCDDLNDHCTFFGDKQIVMPNIERLKSHGVLFKNAYCQYPLCSPSRTSFLTGWRPDKTGIYDISTPPGSTMGSDVMYLPMYFQQFGYRTERYGKIMHDLYEDEIDWDYAAQNERTKIERGDDNNKGKWWVIDVPDSTLGDGKLARMLVASMQQPKTQPFFYALGFYSPHYPFVSNVKYWNLTGDPSVQEPLPVDLAGTISNLEGNGSDNIILPSTPANDVDDIPPIALTPPIIKSDSEWRRTIHAYYSEVAQMDAQLGLLLDEMDRQNLWTNTIVIFFSDHGQHLGEHQGLWAKQTLFRESLHVPFIVCAPGVAPGVCTKLVEMVDIYPTLAELCGLPAPTNLEGISFAPLLVKPNLQWKGAAFSQIKKPNGQMGRSVTTEQYCYNLWSTKGEELYDRQSDPFQYTNLANKAAYAVVLKKMRRILAEGWEKSLPPCAKIFYRDADKDGYGDKTNFVTSCLTPLGFVANHNDCNDRNANIHPMSIEICNGMDDNCNNEIDENSCSKVSSNLSVSPNPSHGTVTITYNSITAGNVQLNVFDKTSKTMYSKTEHAIKGSNTYQLNLSNLINGIYNLQLTNGKEQSQTKLIIEK